MAFKRLIAFVPIQNGQVVMSYGYLRHKPAGSLGTVLQNLDRWGIDEIAVVDISRGRNRPDFSILEQIRVSAVRTPIAFGGGDGCSAQSADQGMARRGRQAQPPREQIPYDRASEASKDRDHGHELSVHQTLADRAGDGGTHKSSDQIKYRRQRNRLAWRQYFG